MTGSSNHLGGQLGLACVAAVLLCFGFYHLTKRLAGLHKEGTRADSTASVLEVVVQDDERGTANEAVAVVEPLPDVHPLPPPTEDPLEPLDGSRAPMRIRRPQNAAERSAEQLLHDQYQREVEEGQRPPPVPKRVRRPARA